MIKNLLDSDEPAPDRSTDPDEVRPRKGKFLSVLDVSDLDAASDRIETAPPPETAAGEAAAHPSETPTESSAEPAKKQKSFEDPATTSAEGPAEIFQPSETPIEKEKEEDIPSTRLPYTPPTAAESIRMSGLAYSAGLVLFASIAFMAVLGWLVDLLLGSTPWGIVVGMLLGSIIGFVQFFRINSEILDTMRPKSKKPDEGMFPAAEKRTPAPRDDPNPK